MSMRPLPTKQEPSLVAKFVGLAVSPIIYSIHIGSVLLGWAYTTFSASLQMPTKVLIAVLQIADGLICDLLAIVSKEPGLKAQVQGCQETISSLQLTKQAQERQIALLQAELDSLKAERGRAQRKNMELSKQLQRLQQRVSRSSIDVAPVGAYDSPTAAAAAAAAAADGFKASGLDTVDALQQRGAAAGDDGPFAAAGLQGEGPHFSGHVAKAYGGSGQGQGPVDYGHVPAKGWYLHACVITAALGVRWWLLNQTDPLQRKVMLVIIWPAVWVYGGLLTKTFPNSYTLRATLACTCWALLGYVAHEMVSVSVRGRQQGLASAL